jgi:hypothetical protein
VSLVSALAKLLTKPQGAVELAIFEHIWQQTPVENVLAELMRAEVFLFAQGAAEAFVAGQDPKPLVSQGKDGAPQLLVFTSPARSKAIARQMPAPSSGLSLAFKDVLRWMPLELGLAVNAGTALAAECSAAQVGVLRQQAGIFRS